MKSAQSFFTFKSKKLHVAAGNKKIWEKNVLFFLNLNKRRKNKSGRRNYSYTNIYFKKVDLNLNFIFKTNDISIVNIVDRYRPIIKRLNKFMTKITMDVKRTETKASQLKEANDSKKQNINITLDIKRTEAKEKVASDASKLQEDRVLK